MVWGNGGFHATHTHKRAPGGGEKLIRQMRLIVASPDGTTEKANKRCPAWENYSVMRVASLSRVVAWL